MGRTGHEIVKIGALNEIGAGRYEGFLLDLPDKFFEGDRETVLMTLKSNAARLYPSGKIGVAAAW